MNRMLAKSKAQTMNTISRLALLILFTASLTACGSGKQQSAVGEGKGGIHLAAMEFAFRAESWVRHTSEYCGRNSSALKMEADAAHEGWRTRNKAVVGRALAMLKNYINILKAEQGKAETKAIITKFIKNSESKSRQNIADISSRKRAEQVAICRRFIAEFNAGKWDINKMHPRTYNTLMTAEQ